MKKLLLSILLVLALALGAASAAVTSVDTITDQAANPGSTATFTLNFNSDTTGYTISTTSSALTDGSGNTITAPTISDVTIAAGATTGTTTFTVSVPAGTDAGSYTGTLTYKVGGVDTGLTDNNYVLTVNSYSAFTLSASTLTFDLGTDGDDESKTVTITNTGSTTLTGLDASFESDDGDDDLIVDEDDNEITMTSTLDDTSIAPGETATLTVKADPDSGFNTGSYDGTITVSATGVTSQTIDVNVEVSSDIDETDICDQGKQGSDFEIDIRNPDSGDEFVPGETIPIEVRVNNVGNDDLDVELEISLYDTDTGDEIDSITESGSIDEDESETFNIDFELPDDIDEGTNYELIVKVNEEDNEEDSCDYESVGIEIVREDEDAIISKASLTPAIGLVCGDDYRLTLYVESTGSDEISGVYVEILDGDLKVKESSQAMDLGDYNDDDNEQKVSFDLALPKDIAEGTYSLEAILYDENGDELDSEVINVQVESCSEEDMAGDLDVQVSEEYAVNGKDLTLSLVITNNGDDSATITVTPADVSWATLTGTEYLETLNPGDETHAYLYYTLDTDTTGKHDLQLTVTDDRGNEVSDVVTVDFGEEVVDDEGDSFFSGIGSWLSEHVSFWTIADIILVLLVIAFIVMLFRKK